MLLDFAYGFGAVYSLLGGVFMCGLIVALVIVYGCLRLRFGLMFGVFVCLFTVNSVDYFTLNYRRYGLCCIY